jgi:hypothetical protein
MLEPKKKVKSVKCKQVMVALLIIAIVIINGIISGFLARSVAKTKGLNENAWTLAGFIIGPLALLAAAGCGDKRLQRSIRLIAEKQGINIPDSEEEATAQFTVSREASEDDVWAAILISMPTAYATSARQENSQIAKTGAHIKTLDGTTIFKFKNDGLLADNKTLLWKGKKA